MLYLKSSVENTALQRDGFPSLSFIAGPALQLALTYHVQRLPARLCEDHGAEPPKCCPGKLKRPLHGHFAAASGEQKVPTALP